MKCILFNKPYGVVCQFSGEQHESTLADYISIPNVYPAGRLDKNSEGLVLLTNDGALQHRLSHPDFNKSKHYWVQVDGCPSNKDLEPLQKGLILKGQKFLPVKSRIIPEPDIWPRNPPIRVRKSIPTTWLSMVLNEGKNHQIRKMMASLGFPVLRLVRYKIDKWELQGLLPGEFILVYPE